MYPHASRPYRFSLVDYETNITGKKNPLLFGGRSSAKSAGDRGDDLGARSVEQWMHRISRVVLLRIRRSIIAIVDPDGPCDSVSTNMLLRTTTRRRVLSAFGPTEFHHLDHMSRVPVKLHDIDFSLASASAPVPNFTVVILRRP